MLPHGGRDPPARMCGLMRSEEEIEEANGSAGAYAPTIIKSYFFDFCTLHLVFEKFFLTFFDIF